MRTNEGKYTQKIVYGSNAANRTMTWYTFTMPIPRRVNHDFFKTWTPTMAYVLGYIAADGAITIGKRGNCYLDVCSIDAELIDIVKKALGSNHTIFVSTPRKKEWSIFYRLQVGSKRIVHDLGELGMTPRKADRMPFPNVPDNFLGDFLRGYFDGDGSVRFSIYRRQNRPSRTKTLRTVFTSCSERFLAALHFRLNDSFSIAGGSLCYYGNAYRLVYAGHDSIKLYKLMFPRKTVMCLQRKYKYFTIAVQQFAEKNYRGPVV